jgi:hypothetical protein
MTDNTENFAVATPGLNQFFRAVTPERSYRNPAIERLLQRISLRARLINDTSAWPRPD